VRILIAEDDRAAARVLEVALMKWGHEVVVVRDGKEALEVLLGDDPPRVSLIDWMMPGVDGIEVCQRVVEAGRPEPRHLIILSARRHKSDIVTGLEAGASDDLTKPVDLGELRARIEVGRRIVELQSDLRERVRELEEAKGHIRELHTILPVCSHCRKIRDDEGDWHQMDHYLQRHADLAFSHGLCPDCKEEHYPELKEKADASAS
jgi:DNA-binding response OmpR family regulator